ncbi:uncharacterized protein G2W53_017719 [Senna tora]|uniref:Myb/SANT-like domain-containing protein n=1 Tax=Senna tora TaxID=362788 RepID=A0A834TUM0_9FABA|nr:uncharacterized protein G2W53_017719 [Senna tora]
MLLAAGYTPIQGRIRTLKANWQIVYDMVNHIRALTSGFGWDNDRKCVVADEHVWEEYLKSQPFEPNTGEEMDYSEGPAVDGGTEASSGSRKRKRCSGNKEDLKEVVREMTNRMGKMFTSATQELVSSIAFAKNMQADVVDEAVMFINGLTVEERQVSHLKIACNPILWRMFNDVPEEKKADWVRQHIL